MRAVHARSALLAQGWTDNVRFRFVDGKIADVEKGVTPSVSDDQRAVVVPAMPNLHSHAFQRAMAGLAELRSLSTDNFWSWRTVMYRFARRMNPDHVEAVACQLYMEMLEAGFSRVGEFHYLHNDSDGSHYDNIAEMPERIAAASRDTGINLTLLPVYYAHSGFGGLDPREDQRRFIHNTASFGRLMESCSKIVSLLPGSNLGVAPHSLRAVTATELEDVLPMAKDGPIHIHVAEQTREVEESIASTGQRPVEWLLDHAPVDERWCLIHATHMTADETSRVAASGAIAGLCPITEANLGDGVFDASRFLEAGGRFGVGSDSNVFVSLSEELRSLEYSQRLMRHERNVVANSGGSTGRKLFDEAIRGGNAALQSCVGLSPGSDADVVSLHVNNVDYLKEDTLLDHWIFAGGVSVDAVWVRGEKLVDKGQHIHRERIRRRFSEVIRELLRD